jgi:hypothetical protein
MARPRIVSGANKKVMVDFSHHFYLIRIHDLQFYKVRLSFALMPFFIAKDKIINIHYNNSHKNTSYIIVNNTIIFRKCRNYTGLLVNNI